MPAIVGSVNINELNGVFNIGDVHTIAPQSFFKTYAGGGSFNSGNILSINNAPSVINIYDSDLFDQRFLTPANGVEIAGGNSS